jgi:hypothetical protein
MERGPALPRLGSLSIDWAAVIEGLTQGVECPAHLGVLCAWVRTPGWRSLEAEEHCHVSTWGGRPWRKSVSYGRSQVGHRCVGLDLRQHWNQHPKLWHLAYLWSSKKILKVIKPRQLSLCFIDELHLVACTYSPIYLGGWWGKITWAQELETSLSNIVRFHLQ